MLKVYLGSPVAPICTIKKIKLCPICFAVGVIKLKQKHALLQGSPNSLMLQRDWENDDNIIVGPDDIH